MIVKKTPQNGVFFNFLPLSTMGNFLSNVIAGVWRGKFSPRMGEGTRRARG